MTNTKSTKLILILIQDGRKLWDPRKQEVVRELVPPNEAWAKSDPDLVALLAKETTNSGAYCISFLCCLLTDEERCVRGMLNNCLALTHDFSY